EQLRLPIWARAVDPVDPAVIEERRRTFALREAGYIRGEMWRRQIPEAEAEALIRERFGKNPFAEMVVAAYFYLTSFHRPTSRRPQVVKDSPAEVVAALSPQSPVYAAAIATLRQLTSPLNSLDVTTAPVQSPEADEILIPGPLHKRAERRMAAM